MTTQKLYRQFQVKSEDIDSDKRTVRLSFSSEEPYQRYFGYEILGHEKGEVDLVRLNNGAPLLLGHDTTKQIGVVEIAKVSEGRGEALVRFSKSQLAEEIYQDVKDGIRRNVSVGYEVNKMVLVEASQKDDIETYRVTRWTPLEVSIVPVPADNSVGVGREHEFNVENYIDKKEADKCPKTLRINLTLLK